MKWFTRLKESLKANNKTQKNKLIVVLFLMGALLILLPSSTKKQVSTENPTNMINQTNPQKKELEKLLSDFTGQKVKVLFSYADTGEIEVISEESTAQETAREASQAQIERKPLLDSNKNIIIKNQQYPKIKGVCIFYFGAYEKSVEEALCRAASSALGAKLHTVEVVFQP